MLSEDELLDLEFAFSIQHHDFYHCGDLYDMHTLCRRAHGHDGKHAAGYGENRRRW